MRFGPSTINYGQPVNRDAPLNRGLVGWWLNLPMTQGGGRLLDLCGKNHGVKTGSPTWSGLTPPGGLGGSVGLVPSAYYLTPSLSSLISESSFTFAVSIWPTASTYTRIATFGPEIGWSTGGNIWVVHISTADFTASGTVTLNAWNRIVLTRNGTTVEFFKNGVSIGSGTVAFTYTIGTLSIGQGTNDPYTGNLDNVVMWDRPLSASEIKADYNASRTGYQLELNRVSTLKRFPPMGPEAAVIVSGNRRRRVLICSGGR